MVAEPTKAIPMIVIAMGTESHAIELTQSSECSGLRSERLWAVSCSG